MKAALSVLAGVFLLTACSPGERAESDPVVDWENYSPMVKQRVDEMAAARDCAGLQNEFDVAEANNAAQRSRTGDGNVDLMGYIDGKMKDADCYQ